MKHSSLHLPQQSSLLTSNVNKQHNDLIVFVVTTFIHSINVKSSSLLTSAKGNLPILRRKIKVHNDMAELLLSQLRNNQRANANLLTSINTIMNFVNGEEPFNKRKKGALTKALAKFCNNLQDPEPDAKQPSRLVIHKQTAPNNIINAMVLLFNLYATYETKSSGKDSASRIQVQNKIAEGQKLLVKVAVESEAQEFQDIAQIYKYNNDLLNFLKKSKGESYTAPQFAFMLGEVLFAYPDPMILLREYHYQGSHQASFVELLLKYKDSIPVFVDNVLLVQSREALKKLSKDLKSFINHLTGQMLQDGQEEQELDLSWFRLPQRDSIVYSKLLKLVIKRNRVLKQGASQDKRTVKERLTNILETEREARKADILAKRKGEVVDIPAGSQPVITMPQPLLEEKLVVGTSNPQRRLSIGDQHRRSRKNTGPTSDNSSGWGRPRSASGSSGKGSRRNSITNFIGQRRKSVSSPQTPSPPTKNTLQSKSPRPGNSG